MQKQLPAGWKWVKLGEVCEVKGGKRLPKGTRFSDVNTGHPYIRVTDFRTGSINIEDVLHISAEIQKAISSYTISSDDVYISIAGTIGLVGRVPYELSGANLTENAAKIVINSPYLIPDFLIDYLKSDQVQVEIAIRTNTVAQPKLALERIRTIPLPLPPLEEQKRIADILNKAEEIKKLREEADKKTEELIPAIFNEMVGSRINNGQELPAGWKWVKLGEVCEFAYGSGLPKTKRLPGEIPVYGAGGIIGMHNKEFINGPAIVIGRKGSAGAISYSEGACWPIDTTFYVSQAQTQMDIVWLLHLLISLRLDNLTEATAVGGLNRNKAYALPIPLPPLDEQQRIADRLNQAEEIKKTNAESDKKIEELKSSLLQRAFRGEL